MQDGKMTKGERREAKRRKKQYGMRVSGRSIKTVLLEVIRKKGQEVSK